MTPPVAAKANRSYWDVTNDLAQVIVSYVAQLRRSYPKRSDAYAVAIHDTADVLDRALVTNRVVLRDWLTQYARQLFGAYRDQTDPYSCGAIAVAGDIQVALLTWGARDRDESLCTVAAGAFGHVHRPLAAQRER